VAKRRSVHIVDRDDAFNMNDTKVNTTQIANVHTDGDPVVMFAERSMG
jgi:hypothetical protein